MLNPGIIDRDRQRERDRGGGCVSVLIDRDDNALTGNAELPRRAVDDPPVGLMGDEPVDLVLALHVLDLVGALQGAVDASHDVGHRADRVEALVGIHLAGVVGVGRDLPTREVDRPETRAHLLHGLVAGQGAQRGHPGVPLVQALPERLGAALGQRVPDAQRAAQALDVVRAVVAPDAGPAMLFLPAAVPRQIILFLVTIAISLHQR